MTKRVTARIPDETDQEVIKWAKRLGLAKAQLLGMAVQAGLGQIVRAVSPVDAFTPSQWATIVKAMTEQGISFDGAKIGSEELPGEKNQAGSTD